MSSFAFQVVCLRLFRNKSLFGIFAVPADWTVLTDEASPMYTGVGSWPVNL